MKSTSTLTFQGFSLYEKKEDKQSGTNVLKYTHKLICSSTVTPQDAMKIEKKINYLMQCETALFDLFLFP